MFVLPLGLDGSTRKFPWMAALIVVCTVSYSVFRFNAFHLATKQRLNSEPAKSVYQAKARLLVKACGSLAFAPADCAFLTEALKDQAAVNPAVGFSKFNQAVVRNYHRGAKEKLEMFGKYLAQDDGWKHVGAEVEALPEYENYLEARHSYVTDETQYQVQNRILSGRSLSVSSLLDAQFVHAGWMHLFGNILLFLLLVFPVEERVGPLKLLITYIVGGGLALGCQVVAFHDPLMPLLGASASVCAVAGLFMILFFKAQMRIWVSCFFVWNKTATMPTWLHIPLFLIVHDIAGVVTADSNVAHLAHLCGFAFGAFAGLVFTKSHELPDSYLFEFEEVNIHKALQLDEALVTERVQLLHEVLSYNRRNTDAQDILLSMAMAQVRSPWNSLDQPLRAALKFHFANIFKRALASDESTLLELLRKLDCMPEDWPVQSWIGSVNLQQLDKARFVAERAGLSRAQVRLLNITLVFTRNSSVRQALLSRINELNGGLHHVRHVS